MFEQDYIMRLISQVIRALIKLITGKDLTEEELLTMEEAKENEQLKELLSLVDEGKINEAENRLSDLLVEEKEESFYQVLIFYSYLNEKETDFLEKNQYTRREIAEGLQNAAAKFGYGGVTQAFLDML